MIELDSRLECVCVSVHAQCHNDLYDDPTSRAPPRVYAGVLLAVWWPVSEETNKITGLSTGGGGGVMPLRQQGID